MPICVQARYFPVYKGGTWFFPSFCVNNICSIYLSNIYIDIHKEARTHLEGEVSVCWTRVGYVSDKPRGVALTR